MISLYLFSLILAAACCCFCLSVFFDSFISLYNALLGSFGERSFSIYGMPVLFPSMLDRFPRSKVLSLFSSCSGYHLPCDLALHFLLLCVGRFPSASRLVLVKIWSCPFGTLDFYLGMCRLSLNTFGRHIYSTLVSYIMLLLASFWIFSLSVRC